MIEAGSNSALAITGVQWWSKTNIITQQIQGGKTQNNYGRLGQFCISSRVLKFLLDEIQGQLIT